jgi:hypothetical protein
MGIQKIYTSFSMHKKKPTLTISTPSFFVHPIITRVKEQTIVANMKFFPRRIKTQNEKKTF